MDSKNNKRVVIGGIFLLLGVLLTLDNLRIFRIDFPDYLFGWYTILIIVGLFMATARDKVGFGIVLAIVGGVFMLDEMAFYYYWNFDFTDIFDLWPLVFVGVGLSLILKRSRDNDYEKKNLGDDEDSVDEVAIFSGSDRIISSKYFKGGKLTSIFGGTSLDLRNADLDMGTNILDVFVLFGGCEVKVPDDMNVKLKVSAIFGGLSDDRKSIEENPENDGKELVVKGLVLFGGGEVKN